MNVTKAISALQDAAAILNERSKKYGSPVTHFTEVADKWSNTLKTKITPLQVLLCMIDIKIIRMNFDNTDPDHLTDILGYTALMNEIIKNECNESEIITKTNGD